MITISIDPVLLSFGALRVHWYGLTLGIAILAGLWVTSREIRRRSIAEDEVLPAIVWCAIAAFVGARLFHVLDRLDYYLHQPSAVLAVQDGGLAIYGAMLGGLAAVAVYARFRSMPMRATLDAAAPAVVLAQAIGRIGCTINGDVPGLPANLPWSFVYTHPNSLAKFPGVPVHPTATYEMVWNVAVFAILWRARTVPLVPGSLMLAYLSLYSLGRFILSFFRFDQPLWLGLSQSQAMALATVIVSSLLFIWFNARQLLPGRLLSVERRP